MTSKKKKRVGKSFWMEVLCDLTCPRCKKELVPIAHVTQLSHSAGQCGCGLSNDLKLGTCCSQLGSFCRYIAGHWAVASSGEAWRLFHVPEGMAIFSLLPKPIIWSDHMLSLTEGGGFQQWISKSVVWNLENIFFSIRNNKGKGRKGQPIEIYLNSNLNGITYMCKEKQ